MLVMPDLEVLRGPHASVSFPKGQQAPRLAEAVPLVPLAGQAAALKPRRQAPAAPVPAIAGQSKRKVEVSKEPGKRLWQASLETN